MAKSTSLLAGVSGEYYVAAELSRRGYIASITLRNTKGIDVLVSNQEVTKQVGIQVKTSRVSENSWMLNKNAEEYYSENLVGKKNYQLAVENGSSFVFHTFPIEKTN